jgi:exopolysaccharide biosynthesis polyprenyl glycosylphosphotransferase
MLRRFSLDFAIFSICLDAVLAGAALRLAVLMRPTLSSLPFARHVPPGLDAPAILYVLLPLLWVLVLLFTSQYDGRRNLRFWKEISTLSFGSLLALAIMAGVLYLTYRDVSRLLFLSFVLLAFCLLAGWRVAYRSAYHLGLLHSVDARNVLIAGASVLGQEVYKQVVTYHVLGLRPVGFLDDEPTQRGEGVQVLGALADARQVVLEQDVDDVIIALPSQAYQEVFQLVSELHTLPVKVWMIPDFFKLALNKTVVEEFAGLTMLDLRAPALSETQRLVKRTFDLVFVLLAMPILLPMMGIIAIAIRLEGSGEVLFRQPRVGENGRVFEMLKFRTMVPNAEAMRNLVESQDDQGHLIHKRADDPRVTQVGRWLRQSSLDELPQAFNILIGDMSLVGPRPELPYLVEKYQPWQRRRFAVPQGLTGWWQVNGRSDRPMHLNTEDDLYYVQNYSVFLDLLILIKTVGAVLRGKGAF